MSNFNARGKLALPPAQVAAAMALANEKTLENVSRFETAGKDLVHPLTLTVNGPQGSETKIVGGMPKRVAIAAQLLAPTAWMSYLNQGQRSKAILDCDAALTMADILLERHEATKVKSPEPQKETPANA